MRFVPLLALVLLASGCSLFGKKDGTEPMELVSFDQTHRFSTEWRQRVRSGQDVGYTQLVPALADGILYVAAANGRVRALDAETGRRHWQVRVRDDISGGVSVRDGRLYYGTYNGDLVALDIEDGSEQWRTRLSGEVLSVPQANASVVAVVTVNDRLYARSVADGSELWNYDSPPPVLTLRGNASPLVTDSMVYAGFANGKLMAFNARNGIIQWEQRVALPQGRSEIERMIDIDATPLLHDGTVYAAAFQGQVAAYSRNSGRNIWAREASIHENMSIRGDTLFASHSDGRVTAHSLSSGETRWSNEQMLRRNLGAATAFGDYVAVVDYKGYLHVMNQSDGEFVARTRIDRRGVRAPMIADGDTLYVYTNRGRLRALQVEPR